MKEILSSQLDMISGGWADVDGSGRRSATNGGSRSGESNHGGNSGNTGNRGVQSFLSQNSPYGSGSGASGFWGGSNSFSGGGVRGGYNANARRAGDNH